MRLERQGHHELSHDPAANVFQLDLALWDPMRSSWPHRSRPTKIIHALRIGLIGVLAASCWLPIGALLVLIH
jgi:hypothetical protein